MAQNDKATGKVIYISAGGGSLARILSERLILSSPKEIVLFDREPLGKVVRRLDAHIVNINQELRAKDQPLVETVVSSFESDPNNYQDISRAIARANEKAGSPDMVFLLSDERPPEDVDFSQDGTYDDYEFKKTIFNNLVSTSNFLQALEPHLQPEALVVVQGSLSTIDPVGSVNAFAVSKFGTYGLVDALRYEWKDRRIRLKYFAPPLLTYGGDNPEAEGKAPGQDTRLGPGTERFKELLGTMDAEEAVKHLLDKMWEDEFLVVPKEKSGIFSINHQGFPDFEKPQDGDKKGVFGGIFQKIGGLFGKKEGGDFKEDDKAKGEFPGFGEAPDPLMASTEPSAGKDEKSSSWDLEKSRDYRHHEDEGSEFSMDSDGSETAKKDGGETDGGFREFASEDEPQRRSESRRKGVKFGAWRRARKDGAKEPDAEFMDSEAFGPQGEDAWDGEQGSPNHASGQRTNSEGARVVGVDDMEIIGGAEESGVDLRAMRPKSVSFDTDFVATGRSDEEFERIKAQAVDARFVDEDGNVHGEEAEKSNDGVKGFIPAIENDDIEVAGGKREDAVESADDVEDAVYEETGVSSRSQGGEAEDGEFQSLETAQDKNDEDGGGPIDGKLGGDAATQAQKQAEGDETQPGGETMEARGNFAQTRMETLEAYSKWRHHEDAEDLYDENGYKIVKPFKTSYSSQGGALRSAWKDNLVIAPSTEFEIRTVAEPPESNSNKNPDRDEVADEGRDAQALAGAGASASSDSHDELEARDEKTDNLLPDGIPDGLVHGQDDRQDVEEIKDDGLWRLGQERGSLGRRRLWRTFKGSSGIRKNEPRELGSGEGSLGRYAVRAQQYAKLKDEWSERNLAGFPEGDGQERHQPRRDHEGGEELQKLTIDGVAGDLRTNPHPGGGSPLEEPTVYKTEKIVLPDDTSYVLVHDEEKLGDWEVEDGGELAASSSASHAESYADEPHEDMDESRLADEPEADGAISGVVVDDLPNFRKSIDRDEESAIERNYGHMANAPVLGPRILDEEGLGEDAGFSEDEGRERRESAGGEIRSTYFTDHAESNDVGSYRLAGGPGAGLLGGGFGNEHDGDFNNLNKVPVNDVTGLKEPLKKSLPNVDDDGVSYYGEDAPVVNGGVGFSIANEDNLGAGLGSFGEGSFLERKVNFAQPRKDEPEEVRDFLSGGFGNPLDLRKAIQSDGDSSLEDGYDEDDEYGDEEEGPIGRSDGDEEVPDSHVVEDSFQVPAPPVLNIRADKPNNPRKKRGR